MGTLDALIPPPAAHHLPEPLRQLDGGLNRPAPGAETIHLAGGVLLPLAGAAHDRER